MTCTSTPMCPLHEQQAEFMRAERDAADLGLAKALGYIETLRVSLRLTEELAAKAQARAAAWMYFSLFLLACSVGSCIYQAGIR